MRAVGSDVCMLQPAARMLSVPEPCMPDHHIVCKPKMPMLRIWMVFIRSPTLAYEVA